MVTSAPVISAPAEWIARIAADFDDDAPRLVYADWLQSQGDPLGELIVVQCERARLDPYDPKQKALAEREAYLLSTYRLRWVPQLGEVELAFHRGLIERVRMELPYDHTKLERVLAVVPLVRNAGAGRARRRRDARARADALGNARPHRRRCVA